jgi:hypothetical protein
VSLDREDFEALADLIADAVAERLDGRLSAGLVDAHAVAKYLDTEVAYVYSHWRELGGRKLPSSGTRGRLRFDLREVDRATTSRSSGGTSSECQPLAQRTPRRRRRVDRARRAETPGFGLLPIKGRPA